MCYIIFNLFLKQNIELKENLWVPIFFPELYIVDFLHIPHIERNQNKDKWVFFS